MKTDIFLLLFHCVYIVFSDKMSCVIMNLTS